MLKFFAMELKSSAYLNYWKRKEILQETIPVPLLEYWPDAKNSPCERMIIDDILAAQSILDYGAGDKKMAELLVERKYSGKYFSQDIGDEFSYDYQHLSEIDEKFDIILLLDVIEHLDLESGLNLCHKLLHHLNKGGRLYIQTPNGRCIRNHLGSDMTHLQLYNAKDLYAYFTSLGYSVFPYRVCFKWQSWSLKNKLYHLLGNFIITRLLGLDYADNILIKISKKV